MDEGWHADPLRRHELRYHDGQRWTEHVADDGQVSSDPIDGSRPLVQRWPASSDEVAAAPAAEAPPAATAPTAPPPGGDWASGGDAPADPGGGRTGWSTGARIGAAVGVLALVVVSGVVGFVLGAASNVGSTIADGFDDFAVAEPDEVADSGAVLSSDQPVFSGTIDGTTSITVRVAQAGTVALEVEEADFDTYLWLYDDRGELVAEDDDGGAEIFLSRIEADLEPGEYRLVLDVFGSGDIEPGTPVRVEGSFSG